MSGGCDRDGIGAILLIAIGLVNPIEILAFALGIVNVTLVVRRSVWNYPFGIAMVCLYAVVFAEAKLYSDVILQGFFVVVNGYGWVKWARAREETGEIAVERMTPAARAQCVAGCLIASAAWGTLMHRHTDAAMPWWDAGIAVFSIAAQILLARRRIENWVLWIAVDIAAIGLYAAKGLWLATLLYATFLLLSIWGLADWSRSLARTSDDKRVAAG